ncbi:class I SAM-dependent methyltransferase [Idiomarina ramblicola]|uniref:Methyltransferase type 11 domain-containing protein n=1 Tax=Idiomarina ramblicola TaxID=263724 RepID=A0A432YUW6_9GAMM|nr:class I SAM-dependent methyltransferase [Idiomarina ramblicola]RUO67124.1 hypothetical protein CWI78_09705 [Idiomarina ramblicola]
MDHWNQYWNSPGVLNSFAEGESNEGYRGTVHKTWQSLLSDLNKGSRILDLGCGNGGLALLATEVSDAENKSFKIEAADAASIDPVQQFQQQPAIAKKLEKITFHSDMPAEQLKFEDGSLDAVVSQFGFEYSDSKKSITEINRVLKKGGVFGAVCHNSNSAITEECRAGAEFIDHLLNHTPVFPLTEVILTLAEQAIPQLGDKGFQEYKIYRVQRNSVMWIIQTLRKQFNSAGHKVWLDEVEGRIQTVFNNLDSKHLTDIRRFLGFHYEQLNGQQKRIQEQANVALSEKDIEQLTSEFKTHGLNLNATEIALEEGVTGWLLTATK